MNKKETKIQMEAELINQANLPAGAGIKNTVERMKNVSVELEKISITLPQKNKQIATMIAEAAMAGISQTQQSELLQKVREKLDTLISEKINTLNNLQKNVKETQTENVRPANK